jgi:hypothetical protein
MKSQVLDTIKSRGHWRVNFQPLTASRRLKSLGDCRDIVERNSLELRGWDYPHFPRDTGSDTELRLERSYCEAWIDWSKAKEFWRMYQSGQFIHYVALLEDWDVVELQDREETKQDGRLSLVGAIYRLTEVYEFASRLTRDRERIYADGVRIAWSLHHTAGRALWLEEPLGLPFMRTYRCRQEQVDLGDRVFSPAQLLQTSRDAAYEAIVYLFQNFGWSCPNVETIKSYQEQLLRRGARPE